MAKMDTFAKFEVRRGWQPDTTGLTPLQTTLLWKTLPLATCGSTHQFDTKFNQITIWQFDNLTIWSPSAVASCQNRSRPRDLVLDHLPEHSPAQGHCASMFCNVGHNLTVWLNQIRQHELENLAKQIFTCPVIWPHCSHRCSRGSSADPTPPDFLMRPLESCLRFDDGLPSTYSSHTRYNMAILGDKRPSPPEQFKTE